MNFYNKRSTNTSSIDPGDLFYSQMSTRDSGRGGGRGGRSNRAPLPRHVQVSKKLSWLLRHGAESEGLKLDGQGFINLQDVLTNRNLRSLKVTLDEVQQIVKENDKQRFTLLPITASDASDLDQTPLPSADPAEYKIRANQGHSLKIDSEGLLQPITADSIPATCIHGTTHAAWPLILASGGLKPMGRNHIHFATGLPSGFKSLVDQDVSTVAAPVISGMRKSSTVLIFVDVTKAMEAGVKFWRSDNGVVLSEGDESGVLPVDLFLRVEDRTGAGVLVEEGRVVKDAPASWNGKGKGKS
jgi:2'-phosphotransferase